ncbi:MAG: A/G-specific adenine glycosylase [Chromatiales bacterium]|jgi:A/G-specific adenine glycosylase|nr:A/G-specific adenine glycosylase [Chromatiales bacterium]MDX9767723.1 A/G-specific adenine glycosylase [Ectothiorhodospiraceae bacterium]
MTGFAKRLIAWQRRHGRHDLPWQQARTPYRVWVSEIMLQQTQVATVVGYFERFMQRFPDLPTLAAAPLDDVLAHWSGLGYYSRARNLHRAARIVAEDHDGELPTDVDALQALPGIGRSTAAAILALAHDRRHAILDGNVKRVLARHAAIDGWTGAPAVLQTLWTLAEQRTPARDVGIYTQAIMDLGATICTRSRPACEDCPVNDDCAALATDRVHALPTPRPRRAVPLKRTHMLLIRSDDRVLLLRRPPAGLWGGLWGLPEAEDTENAVEQCRALTGRPPARIAAWPAFTHVFTHFRLEITPLLLDADTRNTRADRVMDTTDRVWYKTGSTPPGGLAAPVTRLLARLTQTEEEIRR